MESVTIKTWRNGAVGGARQTVNLFSKGQQVRIPLPPPNISRDSEAVKQQSHKLQSLVRFQVPQPNWRCKKPIRGLTSLQINQYCLQIQSLNLDWWRSWLAHMPVTHGVAGSSPVQSAKLSRDSEAVKQQSHKLQSQVRFLVPQPNVPGVSGYCDPQDEKQCDNYGWFQLNRTSVGNTRTEPVGERVEGVEVFPLKEDMFTDTLQLPPRFAEHLKPISSVVEHSLDKRKVDGSFPSLATKFQDVSSAGRAVDF